MDFWAGGPFWFVLVDLAYAAHLFVVGVYGLVFLFLRFSERRYSFAMCWDHLSEKKKSQQRVAGMHINFNDIFLSFLFAPEGVIGIQLFFFVLAEK